MYGTGSSPGCIEGDLPGRLVRYGSDGVSPARLDLLRRLFALDPATVMPLEPHVDLDYDILKESQGRCWAKPKVGLVG